MMARDETDALLLEATAAHWYSTFRAALHPDLVMLAAPYDEECYLIRLNGDQVEAIGPLPRAVCIDAHGREVPSFTIERQDWLPPTAELIHELSPYGAWYVAQQTPMCTRYTLHTQGYHDALAAFLQSPGAAAFLDQPWRVGRVPCLLLFPNGSYATAPDASSQPITLPLKRDSDGEGLRRDLDDQTVGRTWPSSL